MRNILTKLGIGFLILCIGGMGVFMGTQLYNLSSFYLSSDQQTVIAVMLFFILAYALGSLISRLHK